MVVFLALLLLIALVGIRPNKRSTDYLSRDITTSVTGIFALIIFCSHFLSYIEPSNLTAIDVPLSFVMSSLGQLMVSPFLFFSGFGVFESFKKKGESYSNTMPKNRMFKVYFSFFLAWVLFACVSLYFKSDYSIEDYLLSVVGIRSIGNSNWYVVVIILLYLISFVSFKISKGNRNIAIAIHTVLTPVLYVALWLSGLGSWWYNTLVCYLFGSWYSFTKEKIDSFLAKRRAYGILFFIFSLVFFAGLYIAHSKIRIESLSHVLYLLVNLFFCLSLVSFLYLFSLKKKVLLFFGGNCFWIYILQRLPMIVLSRSETIHNNIYVFFVLCFVSTVVLSFILNKSVSYIWRIVFARKEIVSENTNIRVGIVISYVTLAFSILGAFVVTPRLLEVLGDVQYGLRSFATSLATWLTVISSALAASYLRFVNESSKENGVGEGKTNTIYLKIFSFISLIVLLITSAIAAFCFAFHISFGDYTTEENQLITILLLLSGINVSIQIAASVFTHYLTYKKEFIFIRSLNLFVTFLTFALELIFVFITKSVIAVMVVTLALSVASFSANAFFAIKIKKMPFERANIKENSPLLKAIVIFSSFILLNTVVDQINQQVDITILGFLTDAEKVTDYTLSRLFVTYLVSLSVAISSAYAPKIHELVKNGDNESVNELFQRVSRIQLIVVIFIVGGFAACGHSFVFLWLGERKEYIYFYSLALLSLNIIPLSCNLAIEVQRAMNKHRFRAILYIVFALLNVGFSVLLIVLLPKEMAVWGAIFGTVFSIGIGNIVVLNIYNHVAIKLDMAHYFLNVLKYAAIGIVAIAPSVPMRIIFVDSMPQVLLFLINGLSFVLIFSLELLLFDKKTIIPFIRKTIEKLMKRN